MAKSFEPQPTNRETTLACSLTWIWRDKPKRLSVLPFVKIQCLINFSVSVVNWNVFSSLPLLPHPAFGVLSLHFWARGGGGGRESGPEPLSESPLYSLV